MVLDHGVRQVCLDIHSLGISRKFLHKSRKTRLPTYINWGESGSISPLIIFYFLIIITITFLIANVASVYIARRDLISRTESALSIAAQEIDEMRYYYGAPLTGFLADQAIDSRKLQVPIDCKEAADTFIRELRAISLATQQRITVEAITCDGFDLSAKVSEVHELPFQLRTFGLKDFNNTIEAGTASFLLSSD